MRLHNQLFTLKMAGFVQSVPEKGGSNVRTEQETKKALKKLSKNKKRRSPLIERQNIA
jgi:hypothetical protein